MANRSQEENLILIEELQGELRRRFWPVLTTYMVLCIIGMVGNVLTFIYFFMKTTKRPAVKLISYLALIDGGVCVMAFPVIILPMFYRITASGRISCKVISFLAHWSISASTGMLWTIAVDRHRKVCQPHGFQMSRVFANRLVLGLVVFTFLNSSRELSFFEIETFSLSYPGISTNITAPKCAYSRASSHLLAFKVFNIIDALLLLSILVTLIVTYTHIVIVLIRLKRFDREHSSLRRRESKPMVTRVSSETMGLQQVLHKDDVTKSSSSTAPADLKNSVGVVARRNTRVSAERKMSIMMLVVSLGFLMCFAPFFGLRLNSSWKGHRMEYSALQMFIYRFPYLNSVLNPLIYGAINPAFRTFVANVFVHCKLSDRNDRHVSM